VLVTTVLGHAMTNKEFILSAGAIATMDPSVEASYGLISNGSVLVRNGQIAWVGPTSSIPKIHAGLPRHEHLNGLVTPHLIDCHTHMVAGGNRAKEFELRLEGATYEQIARSGGGIVSTVMATREADEEILLRDALRRADALIAEGAGLLEIKSGYGLDIETELKMLRVARQVGKHRPVRVTTSFLGAHAVPPEYENSADRYIDEVCIPSLRAAHMEGLVDCVDGFCESIAFDTRQISRVFDVAKSLGLPVKLHAEQLSNLGGARLAASYGALSVDHIEYLDEVGVKALANAGTCAVLLPGAYYTLRETQVPPVDLLRKHRVPIAVATDCNPGSSPLTSLLLSMNMACTLFRLTPEEALRGVTRVAARAIGFQDTGQISIGKRADMALWNVTAPAELSYRIGFNPLHSRIFGGQFV